MAYYLVRATPRPERMDELAAKLAEDAFVTLRPFGRALTQGLLGARRLDDGRAVWEEEDYCSPPLAMERAAVLDRYFSDIEVEHVAENEGWAQIENLPRLITR
ncbi:MAG: hypothetical protein DCC57_12375 [Chloroflexi bacterium]|nr:MAG: hypothetical protein DCC57_12375 [Chloroflexota bacterium]